MLALDTLMSAGAGPRSSFLSAETVNLLVYLVSANYGIFSPRTDASDAVIDNALYEILGGNMVGQIVALVTKNVPVHMLVCDGSIYQRDEYPQLYEAIDASFIIDANSFRVPDLSRRFLVGEGGDILVGGEGGSETHALTEAEMPTHAHSYTASSATIINGGLEAPASASVPFPTVTGTAGGGLPHNNMPPYMGVTWAIVAT